MNTHETLTGLLREMGLNELEATIYIWLLENKRNTGYKIAVEIGKPVANTYKALKSLESKGAVISDNTTSKTIFVAVPANEFLNKLESEFQRQRDQIIREASKLEVNETRTGIYELQSLELAYEKAISMIESAQHQLLIDSFPAPLEVLEPHLRKKSNDELMITLKNYCSRQFENIRQIYAVNSELVLKELKGHWLLIVKDASEAMIALIDHNGRDLLHCIWTRDPYISIVLYNGMLNEMNLSELYGIIFSNRPPEDIVSEIRKSIDSFQINFEYFVKTEKNLFRRNNS